MSNTCVTILESILLTTNEMTMFILGMNTGKTGRLYSSFKVQEVFISIGSSYQYYVIFNCLSSNDSHGVNLLWSEHSPRGFCSTVKSLQL